MPEQCPFCDRDPFEYVDVGVGSVPVAVTCCEFGDLYFRGARPELTGDVVMPAAEFTALGHRLTVMRDELTAYREKHGPIWPDEQQQ